MRIPRIMIAASASGSGKTTITCGIMSALKQKGLQVAACKCGPDYIDPMFHREVLGVPSENLDLFFSESDSMKEIFIRHGNGADLVITEGVMGYYDGMALNSDIASSYDVSRELSIPTILVVPCRGMALTTVPTILGMLKFREDQQIRGVILNRISGMLYPRMKEMIETELQKWGYKIPVIGYVPEDELFQLESRHLGLKLPDEITKIREQLKMAGKLLAKTIDWDQLVYIAQQAEEIVSVDGLDIFEQDENKIRIGIARDEAFGFYYKENLEILRRYGCELVEFSPLRDAHLPDGLSGLILGGGYPELYANELSQNISMRKEIQERIENKLPVLAECGGFLYLHEGLEGEDGLTYPMVGVILGNAFRTKRLGRFGYINLKAEEDGLYLKEGEEIKAHEFHYWDSPQNGKECLAIKPDGRRSWECVHMKDTLFAGFPHLYYRSNLKFVDRFVQVCKTYNEKE